MPRITFSSIAVAIVTALLVSGPTKFTFEPAVIQVVDAVHGSATRDLNIDVQIPCGSGTVIGEFTASRAGRYGAR